MTVRYKVLVLGTIYILTLFSFCDLDDLGTRVYGGSSVGLQPSSNSKQPKLHGAEQERSCLRADEDKGEFIVLRCSAVSADDSAAAAPDGSTGVLDCGKRRAK